MVAVVVDVAVEVLPGVVDLGDVLLLWIGNAGTEVRPGRPDDRRPCAAAGSARRFAGLPRGVRHDRSNKCGKGVLNGDGRC